MKEVKKYFIVKDKNDEAITYLEYDKMHGYDLSPKKNMKIKDAVDVSKMVIINPTMIQKMVSKKLNAKFEKLLRLLTLLFQTDDETGETYREALNELSKLRLEAQVKYKKYMKEEEEAVFQKKLDILEAELLDRIYYVEELQAQNEEEWSIGGKAR